MRSVDILREEHDAVLYVLTQLDQAVSAAERGAPVPKDIFTDVQEFFSVFVDKCHHGKEETAVFNQLESANGNGRVTGALTNEHDTGRKLSAAYANAAGAYTPGDIQSATRLAKASRDYATLLRDHIEEENRELFPLMERALATQDSQISTEFDRIELEEIGEGTHERLHGMIDSLPGRIAPWVSATTPRT